MFPMGLQGRRRSAQRNRATTPVLSWMNFTPKSLTGLQLWLDASDKATITSSGQFVSQWSDKSDNGYNVTQPTSAYQPVLETLSTGQSTIRFDNYSGGTSRWLTRSSTALHNNVSAITVYAVIFVPSPLPTSARSSFIVSIPVVGGNNRVVLAHSFAVGALSVGGRTVDTDSFVRVDSSTFLANKVYLQCGVWDHANKTMNQYVNGSDNGISSPYQTATTSSATNTSLAIGNSVAGTNWMNGNIAEVLIFHAAHDAPTRNAVNNYLNRKWAIY